MALHSSILAWRIPWTEESGELYSPWGHKQSDASKHITLSLILGNACPHTHMKADLMYFCAKIVNWTFCLVNCLQHFLKVVEVRYKQYIAHTESWGLPCGSDGKESACNVGDLDLISVLGRSPGGGHATHSSILAWRIPMDRGAWRAAVYGVAKSRTRPREEGQRNTQSHESESENVSRSVVFDSWPPHGLQPARLLCPWDSPGKNSGVGCHDLHQGIFPTQGWNPGLLHCRQILYCLSPQTCLIW